MRRLFLVFILILGLCQGLWQSGSELHLYRIGHGETGISESIPEGESLCEPRPFQSFAGFFVPGRQLLHQHLAKSARMADLPKPSIAWVPTAPGQNRRSDDAIHPKEWGLTVPMFARSDG
ncbi:MAG TPA: hypothetical protein PLM07_10080 [Candidatus Rifleibacterium sp.]|nr:hypothetical protein [Candidatus Rifleibacterium sp.]HPT46236.1 hypothetical protein [Candidatus Rifleibacterium sp.]